MQLLAQIQCLWLDEQVFRASPNGWEIVNCAPSCHQTSISIWDKTTPVSALTIFCRLHSLVQFIICTFSYCRQIWKVFTLRLRRKINADQEDWLCHSPCTRCMPLKPRWASIRLNGMGWDAVVHCVTNNQLSVYLTTYLSNKKGRSTAAAFHFQSDITMQRLNCNKSHTERRRTHCRNNK